jgi:hypothetical protein
VLRAWLACDPLLIMNASRAAGTVLPLTSSIANQLSSSSPLLWLVNICWKPCGFCQALEADWQRLARRMRHEVIVSSWDVGRRPILPDAFGDVNATPAIRAMVPAVDGREGRLVGYVGSRQLGDMIRFATALMPNFVEKIVSDEAWEAVREQAASSELPRLLCFLGLSADAETPRLLKALSATYRNLLVADVRVHESAPAGAAIAARFGVSALPSFVALRGSSEHASWRHSGAPTFRRLSWFADSVLADSKQQEGASKDEL